MQFVWGGLAGLVWGALAALLNAGITKRALKKNSDSSLLTANALRLPVDFLALGAVFLLRRRLPFPYEPALIGTAVSLSVLTIVFAFRLSRPDKKDK